MQHRFQHRWDVRHDWLYISTSSYALSLPDVNGLGAQGLVHLL